MEDNKKNITLIYSNIKKEMNSIPKNYEELKIAFQRLFEINQPPNNFKFYFIEESEEKDQIYIDENQEYFERHIKEILQNSNPEIYVIPSLSLLKFASDFSLNANFTESVYNIDNNNPFENGENNNENNINNIINFIKSKKNSIDSNILSIKTLSKTNSDIVNFQSINLNKSRKTSRTELNKENIINNFINNNIKNLNNFIELSESINDEKLIELAKIYLSYDESLENFLLKNKKLRKKIDYSTIANSTSKQSNSSSENLNKAKIINNLNYYENIIL